MRRTLTLIASIGLLGIAPASPLRAEEPLPLSLDGQFVVYPQQAVVSWTGWAGVQHYPSDRDVVVTVDHDGNASPEFTTTVHTDAQGRWQVTEVDLQPGFVVRTDTAVNGEGAEDTPDAVHTVIGLTIGGFDIATDEVWGSSDRPDQGLQVCVGTSQHSTCMNQWFPDGDPQPWTGTEWRYTFPDGFLVPGANISASELDVDPPGNMTQVSTQIPGPPTPAVTLSANPTQGLWNGAQVYVHVSGYTPNTQAFLSINVAANPTGQFQFLPNVQIGGNGAGDTMVSLPRYVQGVDCAPANCILVTADMNDPFGRNASLQLTFGLLELFRAELFDPAQPWLGGTPGAPIVGELDRVDHDEFVWVHGTGFAPYQQFQLNQCKDIGSTQLCRNTWNAMPWAYSDGNGTFDAMVQVGTVMYGTWGATPQWSVTPQWDLRDGATVMVTGSGLPTDYSFGSFPRTWIGAVHGGMNDTTVNIRSQYLDFNPDDVRVNVTVSQALEQQMEAIVHIEQALGTGRAVDWNRSTGTTTYAYTGVDRWVRPGDDPFGPFDPAPVENGAYDCADVLPYDPLVSGAQEAVHCSMYFSVTETASSTGQPVRQFDSWTPIHFARFDLSAGTTSAVLNTKPAGVTLRGEVSCTGFSPEQYLVTIDGTISQTTSGRRPTTVTQQFVVTTTCSGTMTNPGRALWTVFVPGAFSARAATVTLSVTSPGFTANDNPFVVAQNVSVTSPPKGGKK